MCPASPLILEDGRHMEQSHPSHLWTHGPAQLRSVELQNHEKELPITVGH